MAAAKRRLDDPERTGLRVRVVELVHIQCL
jgi:hypothetical protein